MIRVPGHIRAPEVRRASANREHREHADPGPGSCIALAQLNPTARIILGKRISERVYLTYSRTLSGAQNEIILVEFDQNDQLSWVLSRNEDRSFALDFRLRYVVR